MRAEGVTPLYSAVLLAYFYGERDQKVLRNAPVKHWMVDAPARCQAQPTLSLKHGERIDFHFSLDLGFAGRVWPNLSPKWPGFKTCGTEDLTIFLRVSAIDILDAIHAGGNVTHGPLCQHVVIIGGTNGAAADFEQTPLNEMNGSVVMANAIRGLELSSGGLRRAPMLVELALVSVLCVFIAPGSTLPRHLRDHYRRRRRRGGKVTPITRLLATPFHPIVLNGLFAALAQGAGVLVVVLFLQFGLSVNVAGPALIATLLALLQDFFSEEENAEQHPTLTFAEARDRAGLNDQALREALATGALPARKAEGRWHIHQDDLENFRRAQDKAQRKRQGRPWWRPWAS